METQQRPDACTEPSTQSAHRIPRALLAACHGDETQCLELFSCVRDHVREMLERGCSITETLIATKQLVLRVDARHTAEYQSLVEQAITCCIDEYYAAQGQ